MLLLTMREWSGPTSELSDEIRRISPVSERLQGFVTNLELGEAIEMIYKYADAFKAHHKELALTYSLVAVSEIGVLSKTQRVLADVIYVEQLPQNAMGFGT